MHTESLGKPLGVEIRTMVYAYQRGTLIDNIIYFDYQIVNKSPNTYSDFRLALFDDIDLGYYADDYICFDSALRMGITYNGTNDDGASAGHPANSYGTHILVVGTTMIVMPGDTGSYYTQVGSYVSYNNDFSIIGNPTNDTQYNNYIRGRARNGVSLHSLMTATHGCRNHDSDHYYYFTGNPSDTTECSECSLGNIPGDRRFIITTNDFTITPGSMQHVVMGLVTTNPDLNNGCPAAKFDSIRIIADTAWNVYHNPRPWYVGVPNERSDKRLRIYPNPAHDKVYIENAASTITTETIALYNTLGQQVNTPTTRSGTIISVDVTALPDGAYYIRYMDETGPQTIRFMKL